MPRGPLAWDNTADKQWRRSKQVQKGEERTLGERFLLVEYKLHISPSSGCRLDHWRNLPDIMHPRQSPGWKDCSFLKHSYGCGYLLQRMILAFPFLSKKKKKNTPVSWLTTQGPPLALLLLPFHLISHCQPYRSCFYWTTLSLLFIRPLPNSFRKNGVHHLPNSPPALQSLPSVPPLPTQGNLFETLLW